MVLLRVLTLSLAALPLWAASNDTVFTDRFATGIQKALVNDQTAWWRRGSALAIELPCGEAATLQILATAGGDWLFTFDTLPEGITETDNGQLAVTLGCDQPDPPVFSVSANSPAFQITDSVTLVLTGFAPGPETPVLFGVDLSGDSEADITNIDGILTPNLNWIKDFPLESVLLGDASSYSSSIGSVTGNQWTFEESNSAPYTLVAHRDGLTDQGEGQLDLREAQVAALGNAPVVRVGGELRVDKELACGESYNLAFSTNTDDLVPSVGVTYSAATTVPPNSSLSPEGVFSFTPSCTGPDNVLFLTDAQIQAQGNTKSLEQVLVNMDITGVESGLEIFGLDYDFNGQVNNQMVVGENKLELEVPYFCDGMSRDMFILSNDSDNTTYEILEGNNYAFIDPNDPDLLRFFVSSSSNPDCNAHPVIDSDGNVETPGGLENTVVIQATSPLGSKTFSVDTRAYSPMITHVRVEPAQTSGGTPRDPYVVQFDSNMFSEMINLSFDRPSGIPHRMYLVPVIPFDEVDLMRPTRGYVLEHNNQPFWMSLDMFDGVIDASPTASDAGPVFPRPEYTIRVGGTNGPDVYRLRLTVDDS